MLVQVLVLPWYKINRWKGSLKKDDSITKYFRLEQKMLPVGAKKSLTVKLNVSTSNYRLKKFSIIYLIL